MLGAAGAWPRKIQAASDTHTHSLLPGPVVNAAHPWLAGPSLVRWNPVPNSLNSLHPLLPAISCQGIICCLFYLTDAKNKIPGVSLLGQARTQASCDLSQLHSRPGDAPFLPSSSPRSLATAFYPHPRPCQLSGSCLGSLWTTLLSSLVFTTPYNLISSANFINGLFTPSLRIINEDVR